MRRPILLLLVLTLVLPSALVNAQDKYPDHPVKIVVPFPPGGPTDIFAREVAAKLSEQLGAQFVVENVSGAGGNVGTQGVVKARPDGYTLLFASASIAISPTLYKTLGYDPIKDLDPIAVVGVVPMILLTHNGGPQTLQKLIETLKTSPGKYTYASAGNGTTTHLTGEAFRTRAKVDVLHVPYRGTAPALVDVLAGRHIFIFDFIGPTAAYVTAGRLRVLAIASATRSPLLPDVPTISEAGLPGFTSSTWNMFLAPAGTPKPVVDRVNAALNRVLKDPQLGQKLVSLGIEPVSDSTPESSRKLLVDEIKRWGAIVEESGARLD